MDRPLRVAARFEGPPGFANGGFLAGLLAGRGPARVTIRRPVPVDADLVFDGEELREAASPGAGSAATGGGASAAGGDASAAPLATVAPLDAVDVGPPPTASLDAAREAAARTPLAAHHPFPGCFGCGPGHPSGLHCLAGEVGDGVWAVAWTPEETDPPFVWSALDCSSSAPVVPARGGAPHVLGRMEAAIAGTVAVGEPHVVVAWALERDGRRKLSASALLDPRGEPVAFARATWFALRVD